MTQPNLEWLFNGKGVFDISKLALSKADNWIGQPGMLACLDLARACLSNLTDLHLDYAALSLPSALTIPIATIPDNCGFIELVR